MITHQFVKGVTDALGFVGQAGGDLVGGIKSAVGEFADKLFNGDFTGAVQALVQGGERALLGAPARLLDGGFDALQNLVNRGVDQPPQAGPAFFRAPLDDATTTF